MKSEIEEVLYSLVLNNSNGWVGASKIDEETIKEATAKLERLSLNRIENLGPAFRNLTLHSSGEWSIQYRKDGKHLVTGKTIAEVLSKVDQRLSEEK